MSGIFVGLNSHIMEGFDSVLTSVAADTGGWMAHLFSVAVLSLYITWRAYQTMAGKLVRPFEEIVWDVSRMLIIMIVDSSALTEQVVVDVLASAFDSAGQRCSALRVLCLQDDVADHTLKMLRGAMAECRMGNPGRLTTDIGPVIDVEAKGNIENHIQTMATFGTISLL